MKEVEISFKGLGRSASAHNCQPGEMAAIVGAIPGGGALERLSAPQWQYSMPEGCTALGVHHTADGDNCIMVHSSGRVCWMPLGGEADPQPAATEIASVDMPCTRMASVGEMLTLATASGLRHIHWRSGAYVWLGKGLEMPVIEFGVEVAGVLNLNKSYEVPASLAQSKSGSAQPGSGAWTTHPTGHQQTQDWDSAISTINADIDAAIERQIEGAGLWYQPFFVRYALRLHDGSLALPTAPVLMLPSTRPPCIAVSAVQATEDEDVNKLTLTGATCRYFSLRRRVASGLDAKWAPLVQSVEIYATPQIPTYVPGGKDCGGVVAYTSLAGSASAFMGHYSEAGSNFRDWTVADCGLGATRCWDLSPDPALRHKLLSAGDYHLIATIPFADLQPQSSFVSVDVSTTNAEAMSKAPKLDCGWEGHYALCPEVAYSFHNRLLLAGGGCERPQPLHIRTAIAATGTAASLATSATEAAILSAAGSMLCTKQTWGDAPYLDPDAFPRYLHVADPNAYALLLRQGGNCWRLPLRRHTAVGGACWLAPEDGGDFSISSETFEQLTASPRSFVRESATVYTSAEGNPLVMAGSSKVGDGKVMAIHAALQPMSQGQFGQFPLYAFASDGVWALASTDGGYVARQPVSRDVLAAPDAITATRQGVAFVCQRGVMLLRGAKSQLLSGGLDRSLPARISTLPHISLLCSPGQLPTLADIVAAGARLCFDATTDRLWVFAEGSRCALVCDTEEGEWAIADAGISAKVGDSWVQDAKGRLATFALCHGGTQKTLLITRPIRNAEGAPLQSALLAGRLANADVKMIVYGSNDLIHWHTVASVTGSAVAHLSGSPWFYYIVAASAALTPCQDIASLILRY